MGVETGVIISVVLENCPFSHLATVSQPLSGERFNQERSGHLPELLTMVRLPLLSTVYLVDKVREKYVI